MKKRTLVLFQPGDPDENFASMAPMGSPADLIERVAPFNTAPDGSQGKTLGTTRLYGPGFVLEYASGLDELNQVMVIANEPEIAWLVLNRMCRTNGWKMQDADSGQIFG